MKAAYIKGPSVTEMDERMKKAQQHLAEEMAKFAETDSDIPEQDKAEEGRAEAEQEIAEVRGPKNEQNS